MPAPKTSKVREVAIHSPEGGVKTVRLERDQLTLGRSSLNELCYPDDGGLSRQHLALEREGDDWTVRDLGSKNGTFLNGVRIQVQCKLKPGDRVTAGHLAIDYEPASGTPRETVVFVESGFGTPDATVVTSLEGVMRETSGAAVKTGADPTPQIQALIRAGRELAGHQPLNELFDTIVKLSVEAVGAGRGVLMTLEGEDLVVRAALGENFRISRAVRDRVLRDKASLLVRDVSMDEMFRQRMSIMEQRVRSMIAAPLQTNDSLIGLIYVDSPHVVRDFTREDLNLLTVMANVAAIRIEHARLAEVEQAEKIHTRELEQAAEIQQRLLPAGAPDVPGLDVAGHNAACRGVGGDYYDFLTLADGRLALLVGDVSGKGMPAALMMSSLQARVQVLAEEASNLATMVARLNRAIAVNCPSNRFITFFICAIDPATGEMAYSNAGHNPPLLVRRSGEVERLEGGGMILGLFPAATYQELRCRMEPGDVVAMFSDGVTEATPPASEEEFGEERLVAVIAEHRGEPSARILEAVNQAVLAWTQGAPPADDVTLVLVKRC